MGMNNPLISIIIPVYNTSCYIESCLDSIINQEYVDYDCVEIICIDDGSTDDSANIIRKYIERHKDVHIKLFRKGNGGVSSARNFGKKNARGKYIWFIDSDDLVTECSLNKFINIIKSDNNYDFISGKIRYIKDLNINLLNCRTGRDFFSARHFHYSTCFRRSFLDSFGLEYPDNLSYGEDLLFFEMCNLYATKIKHISFIVYLYRQRAGSAMKSDKGAKYINCLYQRLTIYDEILSSDISTKSYKFLLRRKNEVIRNILFYKLHEREETPTTVIKNLKSQGIYPYNYAWDDLTRWFGCKDWLIKLFCFLFPCESYYIAVCEIFRRLKFR